MGGVVRIERLRENCTLNEFFLIPRPRLLYIKSTLRGLRATQGFTMPFEFVPEAASLFDIKALIN